MTIRPATAADLAAVHAVAAGNPTAPHWTHDQFASILQYDSWSATAHAAFVAEHEGAIVGFAIASALTSLYPVEAELESIAVAPHLHGQGIGRALLQAITGWCRHVHATSVRLEVRVGNAAAIALYRRFGFVPGGIRRAYYTAPLEDALCMTLEIS